MNQVTVSSKFQVVIPQAIREMLSLQVGQKMRVIAYDDKDHLYPSTTHTGCEWIIERHRYAG